MANQTGLEPSRFFARIFIGVQRRFKRLAIILNNSIFKQGAPVILALDTSSKATSMAIARGADVIKTISSQEQEVRSEKLWAEFHSLLEEAHIGIRDVDLFGVCVGPGGFTGLRVGISAAKGLAAASGKPLAGVTSLEALASQAHCATRVFAMTNAYKGEVYSQLFMMDEQGAPIALGEPVVSTSTQAIERIGDVKGVTFVGECARENIEAIRELAGNRIEEIERVEQIEAGWRVEVPSEPIASAIARLSYLKFIRGKTVAADSLRACYVRPAEAEIKLSLGLLGSKVNRSLKAE
jgi:tRNA threonylcarbamoyladenosine biosynthesis protein TsaB